MKNPNAVGSVDNATYELQVDEHHLGDTRQRLLLVAREHLAERGYHGTSLSMVAASLGLSKQALLHHFKSKDQLYRAVLKQLNGDLLALVFAAMEEGEEPEHQLEVFFRRLAALGEQQPVTLRLLLREMIDGMAVAPSSSNPSTGELSFLEPIVALIQATRAWQDRGVSEALGHAVQLLGAVCLFPSAQTTISAGFGDGVTQRASATQAAHFQHLVRQSLTPRF